MHPSDSDLRPIDAQARHGWVAVVDDDPYIASALKNWLSLLGVDSWICPDAEALFGVLLADLSSRRWSVRPAPADRFVPLIGVVVDLNLPGLNGFQVARRLHLFDTRLPVVVITAAGDSSQLQLGGVPAGVACLRKPFELDELESLLFDRP